MFRFMLPAAVAAVFLASSASASERHFTQSYESNVLPKNSVEIETWNTLRMGKDNYFMRFDHRLEFEFGLTDQLQTALYLNLGSTGSRQGNAITTESEFTSLSSEWKLKLSDSVGDAIGSALYFELTAGAQEYEVEAKIILDKRMDRWLFAFNGVYEHEITVLGDELRKEHKASAVAGATYFFSDHMTLGVEAFGKAVFEAEHVAGGGRGDIEMEHAAVWAGPVLGYAAKGWWTTISITPQLVGIAGASAGSSLNLNEFERAQARILLGFHL